MRKPKAEPKAVVAPNRSVPVEVADGVKLARRVIFQAAVGDSDSLVTMVTRIAVAKTLGYTMFEIDVTPVEVAAPAEGTTTLIDAGALYFRFLGGRQEVVEGDEWKETQEIKRKLVTSHVITVFALVVE